MCPVKAVPHPVSLLEQAPRNSIGVNARRRSGCHPGINIPFFFHGRAYFLLRAVCISISLLEVFPGHFNHGCEKLLWLKASILHVQPAGFPDLRIFGLRLICQRWPLQLWFSKVAKPKTFSHFCDS